MFTLSKYEKWYWYFIDQYVKRGWTKKTAPEYVEGHHPYPKGLFGKRENTWIVWVTPREHYVLHLLLSKFTPLPMPLFWKEYTSRQFSPARSLKSKAMQGEKHHLYGVGHTEETIEKLRNDPRLRSLQGKVAINNGVTQRFIHPDDLVPKGWERGGIKESEESRRKKSSVDPSKRGVNRGRQFSEEWLKNMSLAQLNKPLIACEVCGKQVRGNGALASHKRKHDPAQALKMSLIAQLREANKRKL